MASTPAPSGTLCLNHPNVQATMRCKGCHKPLCNSCAQKKPEGVFCSDACFQKLKNHQGRWTDMKAQDAQFEKDLAAKRAKKWVSRLVFFLVVGGVVWFTVTHPNLLPEPVAKALSPVLKLLGR